MTNLFVNLHYRNECYGKGCYDKNEIFTYRSKK